MTQTLSSTLNNQYDRSDLDMEGDETEGKQCGLVSSLTEDVRLNKRT